MSTHSTVSSSTADSTGGNPVDAIVYTTGETGQASGADRQIVNLGGQAWGELSDVKAAEPASNASGLVVRQVGTPMLDGAISDPVQVTAGSSATALVPSPLAGMRKLIIQCDPASPEGARIGSTAVNATHGLALDVGASMELDCGPTVAAALRCWSAGGGALLNVFMRA